MSRSIMSQIHTQTARLGTTLAAALLLAQTATAAPKQVLAVLYDGAEYAVVRDMYIAGQLPHLRSVGALGTMTAITPCAPERKSLYNWPCQLTITAVQHATMLTGADFTVTGVDDNRDWWITPVPAGLTIFERLKALNPAIHTAYIRDQGHCITKPILNDYKWQNALWAIEDHSCGNVTEKVITHAQEWQDEDYLIIAHFDHPDDIGHEYGFTSSEYREGLRENDQRLGQILRHLTDSVRIYLFADHGFGQVSLGRSTLGTHIHRDFAQTTFFVRNNITGKAESWNMAQPCGHWLRYFGGAGLRCGPLTPTPRDTDQEESDHD